MYKICGFLYENLKYCKPIEGKLANLLFSMISESNKLDLMTFKYINLVDTSVTFEWVYSSLFDCDTYNLAPV
jgi:hypothetical protein